MNANWIKVPALEADIQFTYRSQTPCIIHYDVYEDSCLVPAAPLMPK